MGRAVGIRCACGRQVETYLGRGFVTLLWEDDDSGILERLNMMPIAEEARERNLETDEFLLDPSRTLEWVARLRRLCGKTGADLPPFYRIRHHERDDPMAGAAPIFRLDSQHFLVEAHDTVIAIRPIDPPEEAPVVVPAAAPGEKSVARWRSASAMTAAEFDQIFAGSAFELERGTLVDAFAAELAEIEQLAEHAVLDRHALHCVHY